MRSSPAMDYTSTIKLLHWTTALIWVPTWIVAFVAVHWRDAFNHEHQLTFLHKATASTILFLTLARMIARRRGGAPELPTEMSAFARRAAYVGHVAIYALALVALPLSGWFWSSVAGKPILVLGVVPLPPLVAPDKSLYDVAKWVHTYCAWAGGLLIAGHIAAALKHRFVDRDGIMRRMSFGARAGS